MMIKTIISKISIQASLAVFVVGEAFAETAGHHGDLAVHHAGDAADAAHSSSGFPQLDPTWFPSQIFWLVIMFVSLYIIFSKKVLPELSSTIENRNEHIQSDLGEAEKLKSEAENIHQAYEDILETSRTKASELFAKVEDDIKAESGKALDGFRDRSGKEMQKMEKNVAKAIKSAMVDMDQVAAEIASEAAEKIVGISTDVNRAKSVIENINKKAA